MINKLRALYAGKKSGRLGPLLQGTACWRLVLTHHHAHPTAALQLAHVAVTDSGPHGGSLQIVTRHGLLDNTVHTSINTGS